MHVELRGLSEREVHNLARLVRGQLPAVAGGAGNQEALGPPREEGEMGGAALAVEATVGAVVGERRAPEARDALGEDLRDEGGAAFGDVFTGSCRFLLRWRRGARSSGARARVQELGRDHRDAVLGQHSGRVARRRRTCPGSSAPRRPSRRRR